MAESRNRLLLSEGFTVGKRVITEKLFNDVKWYFENTGCNPKRMAEHFAISQDSVDKILNCENYECYTLGIFKR